MIKIETFDHIILVVLSGQLTIDETQDIVSAITHKGEETEDVYLIGIPINMTGFPSKLTDMIEVSNNMRKSQSQVKRVYGIKYNPVFSFITSISTQLLRLKNNTVEADNVEELFGLIEREAEIFPGLKSSWERHAPEIKAILAQHQQAFA